MEKPKDISENAIFDTKENEWLSYTTNSDGIRIGKEQSWYPSGTLKEEVVYEGEEGDTLFYKAYTKNGNLYQEGNFLKGLRTTQKIYRCEDSDDIDQYGVSEDVYCVEAIVFSPQNLVTKIITYDKEGNTLGEKSYGGHPNFTQSEFDILKAYHAAKRGNYGIAINRLKEIDQSKFNDTNKVTYQFLDTCISIIINKAATSEDIENIIALKRKSHRLQDDNLFVMCITIYIEAKAIGNDYNEIRKVLREIKDKYLFSSGMNNPFWEWELVLIIKLKLHALSDTNYYLCRQLARIESAGKRTSISDFILESEEYKHYKTALDNVPKNYTYDAKKSEIHFHGDVYWDGDFLANEIYNAYPEIGNICKLIVDGNFIINGEWNNHQDFDDGKHIRFDYDIKGNVEVREVNIYASGIHIKGSLTAKRCICFDMINEGNVLDIKGIIDTPVVLITRMILRHKGGFSDNCIVIADEGYCGKQTKIHYPSDLNENVTQKDDYGYPDVLLDKVIEAIEKGESIFAPGYDPNASRINIALEKMALIPTLLKQNNLKKADKVLKSVTNADINYNEMAKIEKLYYATYILYITDKTENTDKIEKACKKILNASKSLADQHLKWEILCFASAFLAEIEESKGNDKKVLDYLSQYNKGDEAHYVKKAKLLWKLGKEKEALFPAYIAIQYYQSVQLNAICDSTIYQQFVKDTQKEFSVPKGYKTSYHSGLKTVANFTDLLVDIEENEEEVISYKGDVFWNGDMELSEEVSNYFKVTEYCTMPIVIMGDLYIKGNLFFNQIDIIVMGNVFVEEMHQGDSIFECIGNLFASKQIIMMEDIGGTEAHICGKVKTPVFVAYPSELKIDDYIDPETVCIGIKGYEFDELNAPNFHADTELVPDIVDDIVGYDLANMLKEGTLFKK